MSVPARVLKTAVLDLLAFEGTADMSALPVTDLIDLMSDRDEVRRPSNGDFRVSQYCFLGGDGSCCPARLPSLQGGS